MKDGGVGTGGGAHRGFEDSAKATQAVDAPFCVAGVESSTPRYAGRRYQTVITAAQRRHQTVITVTADRHQTVETARAAAVG